jgi:hypothetical protein
MLTQVTDISALKMKAACSSETLVDTYKSAWHYNSEDQHWQQNCVITWRWWQRFSAINLHAFFEQIAIALA